MMCFGQVDIYVRRQGYWCGEEDFVAAFTQAHDGLRQV
jgi:hypothetical protein